MTRPVDEPHAPNPRPPSDVERLDSWKEIAAFLQRDVRTVQRWEKQAGLPVHRHAESRLRTAYAYRSELDAWWRAQRATDPSPELAPGRRTRRVLRGAAIVAAALVSIVAAVAIVPRFRPTPPQVLIGSTPKVGVLLARIEDQIGDPALSTMVEEAVGRQFAELGFDAAGPARVSRALRLMRRDPRTPVTVPIAREICVREGGIAFVVSSRIHKLQSQYFVDLQAVEPGEGRIRASVEGQTGDRERVVSQAREAAARLSKALVAAPPPPGPITPIEPVTSSSLPAVRLYTSAVQAGTRRQWGASELLARRAITADSQFASAYAWIGWAMRQQGRPIPECLPSLERAMELSANTTDREVYLIAGTRHLVAGDLSSSSAAYEALLRLQPRDRLALDRLIETYARSGRIKEAVDLSVARGEYEPADFYANVRAAHALVVWQGDRRRASPFVQRAQQLASPAMLSEWPRWTAWLSALPVFDAWIAGNHRPAFDALASLERGLDRRIGRERDAFATTIGFSYLAFGRLHQARTAFRHAAAPTRQIDLAMLELASGREQDARDWLLQVRRHSAQRPALFARVGLTTDAGRGLEAMVPSEHFDGITEVTRGLSATRTGDIDGAMASLRRGIELLRFSGEPEYFLGVEALARIWLARGEIDRAADWLGDASEQRARTYGTAQWTAGAWIGVNADLFRICRHHGRREQAQQLRVLLARTLQDADEQHAVAKALRSVDR